MQLPRMYVTLPCFDKQLSAIFALHRSSMSELGLPDSMLQLHKFRYNCLGPHNWDGHDLNIKI